MSNSIYENILNIYKEKEFIKEVTGRKIGNSDFSSKDLTRGGL